jgi:hypothetical protein
MLDEGPDGVHRRTQSEAGTRESIQGGRIMAGKGRALWTETSQRPRNLLFVMMLRWFRRARTELGALAGRVRVWPDESGYGRMTGSQALLRALERRWRPCTGPGQEARICHFAQVTTGLPLAKVGTGSVPVLAGGDHGARGR